MVKLLFMDVDGTLTNGKVYISNDGELFKTFDIKDGYAIGKLLPQYSIIPVVITGRESGIIKSRAKEIGISEVYQGIINKMDTMKTVALKYGISVTDGVLQGTSYIGDDIPDIECMKLAEVSACPADAAKEVKAVANYVCRKNGGDGAVREFIEWIIEKKPRYMTR